MKTIVKAKFPWAMDAYEERAKAEDKICDSLHDWFAGYFIGDETDPPTIEQIREAFNAARK